MKKVIDKFKNEEANSLIENAIILPLIFIIIYVIILTCFIVHDRSTLDAAAKRGAIYAAHCISDPNYDDILRNSGSHAGSLDTSIDITDGSSAFNFSQIGKDVMPYRYITNDSAEIDSKVEAEIRSIVDNTRIQWRELEVGDIKYEVDNKFLYQDITVTIEAHYPMFKFFSIIGMEDGLDYSVTAKMTVNDPDEFIRNADMVVDLIVDIDNRTGNEISTVVDKVKDVFEKISTTVLDWIALGET